MMLPKCDSVLQSRVCHQLSEVLASQILAHGFVPSMMQVLQKWRHRKWDLKADIDFQFGLLFIHLLLQVVLRRKANRHYVGHESGVYGTRARGFTSVSSMQRYKVVHPKSICTYISKINMYVC